MVYLPVGGGVVVNSVRKGSLVRIGDVNLPVDLIVLDLKEFDVILGMDWLAQHKAIVDCYKKEVMIECFGESKVILVGDRQVVPVCVISAMEARRLMLEGCEAYLAHVVDTERVYQAEYFAVGSTSAVCEEERWEHEVMHRLPAIKQSNSEE